MNIFFTIQNLTFQINLISANFPKKHWSFVKHFAKSCLTLKSLETQYLVAMFQDLYCHHTFRLIFFLNFFKDCATAIKPSWGLESYKIRNIKHNVIFCRHSIVGFLTPSYFFMNSHILGRVHPKVFHIFQMCETGILKFSVAVFTTFTKRKTSKYYETSFK